jgi:hypothetical protein
MTALRRVCICLVLAMLVAGTLSDVARKDPVVMLGGYRVLSSDFHVHSFPLSWAMIGPLDTVLEARRQGLDVIAMTPHNEVWVAKLGRLFSRIAGGPTVLVGEEIVSPRYHLLAVGIESRIDWRQSAANAIVEVHKQRGVAIAAHPVSSYWQGYDEDAMHTLDAAEVLHPIAYLSPESYAELQEFRERARVTAIGDSDYHGLGPLGLCRTFVFVRDDSEGAILDALRTGHTVLFDRDGHAFGDPELIRLAARDPRFGELRTAVPGPSLLIKASSMGAILGILGLLLFASRYPE